MDRYAGTPRIPWTRVRQVLDLLADDHPHEAARCLETVRYHPALPPAVFALYADMVRVAVQTVGTRAKTGCPAQYTGALEAGLHPPFRQVRANLVLPAPYPAGMALPAYAGAGNDTAFIRDAARAVAAGGMAHSLRVDVFIVDDGRTDVAAIVAALAQQQGRAQVTLTVTGAQGSSAAQTQETGDGDLTVFLSGHVVLDDGFLERACHLACAGDMLVQVLGASQTGTLLTGWYLSHGITASPHPWRHVQGLNMVVPTALLRRTGLADVRFASAHLAARELAWRMYHKGAYFAPLAVPVLEPSRDAVAEAADGALFTALCPGDADRAQGILYEQPRVDIYIPAYNAARYICRAVDSVLEQDFTDLAVCVADDGSTDGTYELLQKQYGDNPRVRLETGANGGIGHASNRAIEMGRAPYVGQLDADDCLKPGAVRKLAAWLDAHSDTACVYGSCERIDAQGVHIKNEFNWPVFSREKMMVTSIVHHFRMFRRAAWARTTGFRTDITNAVDYDLLLKLSETGAFHHLDEILYQRRWHGGNTSDVNEQLQTANTHIAQNEALGRLGLDRFWQIHLAEPERPRQVGYRRRAGTRTVLFWPDTTATDPAQHLLYASLRTAREVCAGDIDAALEQLATFDDPASLVFHLHGDAESTQEFVDKIALFVAGGGRFFWTPYTPQSTRQQTSGAVSGQLVALAHGLHFYSPAAAAAFGAPQGKVRLSRHGHYIGSYPDFVTREQARAQLGLSDTDDVVFVLPQECSGAQTDAVVAAFDTLREERPTVVLLVAGAQVSLPAHPRIHHTQVLPDDMALQVFMRAADVGVCVSSPVSTPRALLKAFSFDLPVVTPAHGPVRDVEGAREACVLYDGAVGEGALVAALRAVLARKESGTLEQMRAAARSTAVCHSWPDFADVIDAL